MTQHTHCDILIVGAGLVGASTALALQQSGHHVILLEARLPDLNPAVLTQGFDPRIFAISPGNQRFLASLNAWPSAERLQSVKQMSVFGDQGGKIEFNAQDLHASHLTTIAENRWLLSGLWAELAKQNVTLISGQRGAQIKTDLMQAELTLDNGERISAKLIIGADGANSWVRQQAGIDIKVDPYHHHGVVANFKCAHDHEGVAYQWFKDGEILAYLPLPNRHMSMVWSTSQPQKLLDLSPEALAVAVAERGQQRLGALEVVTPANAFELRLIRPQATTAQRILLVGDAAHTIHPLAGQGVNLGFGDAQALAQLLHGTKDPGQRALLTQYAQRRLEPVRTMQMGCDALFKLFGDQKLPLLPWLRNTGLNLTNQLGPVKKKLIAHAMGLS
ncbi:MAG: UbiH/UbiF family hydroxylase [Neisseriaceae bacterium]|nr:UbiH/UbiF family hydroxylase [Neisseriaceae bacterium]MBP6861893.1 UbiH/UbiF family hydroxylase [Neisseriaceae bacterium]